MHLVLSRFIFFSFNYFAWLFAMKQCPVSLLRASRVISMNSSTIAAEETSIDLSVPCHF